MLQGTYTGLLFEQIKNSQEQDIEPEIQQIDSGLVGKLNAGYSYEVKMLHIADHKNYCLYVCVQKRYQLMLSKFGSRNLRLNIAILNYVTVPTFQWVQ